MYKFNWPPITVRTKKAVIKELDKGEISIYDRSGVFEEFENKFAAYHGVKHALLFSSGTSALHAAMVSCGFKTGDEVICPAYTFYATVTPIFQTGAKPILCESKLNGNIDPREIRKLITTRTKAIIITHMWGIPCDMEEIKEICDENKLLLIEDCSHAHGATYKGRPLGSFGDVSVFSLQGQKIITGGEGGVLLTNDPEKYYRGLLFGHYNKRCKQEIPKSSKYYDYAITGFGLKLRAHPFAIAMALEQFSHLKKWHKSKVKNASYLSSLLEEVPFLSTPSFPENSEASWYGFVFLVDFSKLKIGSDKFCTELINSGILDADIPNSTCPLNMLKLFQKPEFLYPGYKGFGYKPGDFPIAERFFSNAIKLPIDIRTDANYKKFLKKEAGIIKSIITKYTR